ncbi:hypothetical protein ASPBRDRAFT_515445 [Aspergillus brasiliensis CBS 101740]|uniref:Uncharacterized protein n=1 Tax=Aspergillus brasiliensis (strain CBS 101740 / IMI 381727 / IBT 21946) TaxID=767769 RepID=A0A1L9UQH7_ASPBC|nr:hypothetical protein ASPBRDRAFT_515445 [Aspergillus brasiliensis CBS 101740]
MLHFFLNCPFSSTCIHPKPDCYGLVVWSLTHIPTRTLLDQVNSCCRSFRQPALPSQCCLSPTVRATANFAISILCASMDCLQQCTKRLDKDICGDPWIVFKSVPASKRCSMPIQVKRLRLWEDKQAFTWKMGHFQAPEALQAPQFLLAGHTCSWAAFMFNHLQLFDLRL